MLLVWCPSLLPPFLTTIWLIPIQKASPVRGTGPDRRAHGIPPEVFHHSTFLRAPLRQLPPPSVDCNPRSFHVEYGSAGVRNRSQPQRPRNGGLCKKLSKMQNIGEKDDAPHPVDERLRNEGEYLHWVQLARAEAKLSFRRGAMRSLWASRSLYRRGLAIRPS